MDYSKKITDYIGDISQIGGVRRYVFSSGRAKGVEAFDINNGSGLIYTVLADRGMDICHLSYKGIPVSFVSKTGIVSPYLYNSSGDEWLRNFVGGFLTTCGLTQVGDSCTYESRSYGLHGPYSNLPAENINIDCKWENDEYAMRITGEVRQVKVQQENLILERRIETRIGVDRIILEDAITNEGSRKEPFMILYHMNFGYPLLNPECDIIIPSKEIRGWDEYSGKNIDRHLEIGEPDDNAPELTYYHDVYSDKHGNTEFMIANRKVSPDIGVCIKYNSEVLHNLTQWKFLRKKDYIMAFEPCNNMVKGITCEAENGTLKYIEPGEKVTIKLVVEFLSSPEKISNKKELIRANGNV